MKSSYWRLAFAGYLLVLAGSVHAADPLSRPTPLDLRPPPLDRIMSRGELLADIVPGEEPIEVVAEPPLLPMTSDADAPLGIVDSLGWSVDHPTQAWRLLLPANDVRDPYN